jgi:pyridoxamine 5'-phosphate oxidase like protein
VNEADRELLQALIQGFDRAMLVCRCSDGMRARPTTVASSNDSEYLWLLSGTRDTRFEELDVDPNVNVVMQDGGRFCSVTGTARVARYDADDFLGDGPSSPKRGGYARTDLVLIEIAPQFAEYWDRSGLRGLRIDEAAPHRAAVAQRRERQAAASPMPSNVISLEEARWRR